MVKGLNLFAYWGKDFGMGKIAEYFYNSLKDKLDLKRVNVDLPTQAGKEYETKDEEPIYNINIYFVNAGGIERLKLNLPPAYFYNKFEIGVWFWELEDFNPKYYKAFTFLDEVWVFTDFIKKSLEKISPIPVKKFCLPYTYPTIYKQEKNSDLFKFFLVFDFFSDFERKNPIGAIRAFKKAFGRNYNVEFMIKTINGKSFPEYLSLLKKEIEGSKNIKIIDGFWKRRKFYEEMASSNVYISLHRAEGLGLNILDALFLDVIPVVTNYGGIIEFFPKDYKFFVPYKMAKAKPVVPAYNFKGAMWAEPNTEEASKILKFIYDNYRVALMENKRVKNFVNKKLTSCFLYKEIRNSFEEDFLTTQRNKNPIPEKNIYKLLKNFLNKKKVKKILLFYSAPEERILRIVDSIRAVEKDIVIDIFGKRNERLKNFSNNFFEYPESGFYRLKKIPEALLQEIKKEKYELIIIPYSNNGEGYDNIVEIAKNFRTESILGITINNDLNFIKQ